MFHLEENYDSMVLDLLYWRQLSVVCLIDIINSMF